jgi:membrane-associated phospholipid phosphatase
MSTFNAAIAISTMTMHEHNFLDVIAGILLALWGVNLQKR